MVHCVGPYRELFKQKSGPKKRDACHFQGWQEVNLAKKVAGSRGDFFVCFILFLLSVYQGDEGGEKVGGWVPEHIGHYKAGGCFGLE